MLECFKASRSNFWNCILNYEDYGVWGTEVGTVVMKVGGKCIYNLITKHFYWNKPTLTAIYSALWSMKCHARDFQVFDIAVPFLGAGCDKIDFYCDVLPMPRTLVSIFTFTVCSCTVLLISKGL